MPGGNSDSSRLERLPAVTIASPLTTRFLAETKSSSRSLGLPTAGLTIPLTPVSATLADTPDVWSVIRVTCATVAVTEVTLPTSPSPSTTGWSTCTPELEPRSTLRVWYQTVGERPITRAVTG